MATYTKAGVDPEALKGTKTEQNLHTALSGEAQAYLRYKWFGKKAKNDGYVAISRLFEETAGNEMEHAEIWFRYLGGYSSTERNLDALTDLMLEAAENGLSNLQFNTIDTETLLDALEHPERYPDLAVRVEGYSQCFHNLSRDLQDQIIGRTKHNRL